MNVQGSHLRELTAKLKENLELCAKDPTVDAVHDVRTGTRRVEAMLDTILRNAPPVVQKPGEDEIADPLPDAAERWLRLLKKIRRAAAPVRDLDVHRELLDKLVRKERSEQERKRSAVDDASEKLTPEAAGNSAQPPPESTRPENAPEDAIDTSPTVILPVDATASASEAPPMSEVERQADDLDAWLKHARSEHVRALVKSARKWTGKLDGHLASLEEALRLRRARRASQRPAISALDAFARLAYQMEQLDAGNLHDFRKGAKKARYMAEAGGEDEYAGVVGKALKKLQDEIGDWHDWLVLSEEAESALGSHGRELTALLERQRDEHFAAAMKTTERLRGRLMGEWQAANTRRRRRPAKASPPAS